MNFEKELMKGNFMISTCPKCEITVWPPNNICSKCFGAVNWEKCSEVGKLVEFSKENEKYFCLAEFDRGVRIMGVLTASSEPKIGQKVELEKASMHDGNYCFEMNTI